MYHTNLIMYRVTHIRLGFLNVYEITCMYIHGAEELAHIPLELIHWEYARKEQAEHEFSFASK